jgi:hypothetical protein
VLVSISAAYDGPDAAHPSPASALRSKGFLGRGGHDLHLENPLVFEGGTISLARDDVQAAVRADVRVVRAPLTRAQPSPATQNATTAAA